MGELIFYQLSKQQLMYGPMQIDSRIDQAQDISKDLTLWNQQGSHVLRGNMIALPVNGDFLYVESIYLQASEARMPKLKKVVLAMGDRLIYRDTFDEALADLHGAPTPASSTTASANGATTRAQLTPNTAALFATTANTSEESNSPSKLSSLFPVAIGLPSCNWFAVYVLRRSSRPTSSRGVFCASGEDVRK